MLFSFNMQLLAYFVGCSSNDNLIFRAFAISFWSVYLSGASGTPSGPAGAT